MYNSGSLVGMVGGVFGCTFYRRGVRVSLMNLL